MEKSSLIIERVFTAACEEFCADFLCKENMLEAMQPHVEELVLYMIENLGNATLGER